MTTKNKNKTQEETANDNSECQTKEENLGFKERLERYNHLNP